jgi:hypothetical protein
MQTDCQNWIQVENQTQIETAGFLTKLNKNEKYWIGKTEYK